MPPPRRVFTDGSVKVGAETLLSWKPDIILVNYYNDSIKPEDILNHPVLSGLDAVKRGRVYKTPAIDPATSAGRPADLSVVRRDRLPGTVSHRCPHGHPSRASQRLYNAKLTPAQLDALLQMSWNGKSAGYAATFAASHSSRRLNHVRRDRRPLAGLRKCLVEEIK